MSAGEYVEGGTAATAGVHHHACPYNVGTPEHKDWMTGWLNAQQSIETWTGSLHKRSRQMAKDANLKAYAERHVETAVDRVLKEVAEEVTRHEERRAEVLWEPLTWAPVIDPGPGLPDNAVLQRFITRMVKDYVAKTLFDGQPLIMEVIEPKGIEPDEQRTIRGKPAPPKKRPVCPQHGLPKGMCKKCWRKM